MAESSFDIGATMDRQELKNALDGARKEISQRFDFKNAHIVIELEKDAIALEAPDEMKIKQVIDIVQTRMLKRDLSIKAVKFDQLETNVTGVYKCKAPIQSGLSQDQIKKINKLIKDSKIKVQTRVQGDQIRVSSKSKNDLQAVQKAIREADFDFATTFENYR